MSEADEKQRLFLALADPTRRQLIEILSTSGDKTATGLANELPISRQGVSKHLRILAEAELVTVRQSGRERYYSLRPQQLLTATTWVDRVRSQWQRRLAALAEYLDQSSAEKE